MGNELLVALFDVLGFEDRIGRFSFDEVHGQYKELLSIATNKGSHAFFDARPAGAGTMVPFFGFINIEQDYFSDTILLWSPFSPSTFRPFLHVCSSFMCETLHAELPIRGALALGTAIMDKSTRTYIGPPLVEAARAEKAQQWIGLSFGPSFASRRDVQFSADLVRPYTKHRKPGYGGLLPGLVVDWPRAWRKEYRGSAVPILERLSRSGRVPEYYRCTIEFVRHSDTNAEWWETYQGKGH
ncbi:MAG: hypothetical protein WAW41_13640 [Methylobacter sp.]